MNIPVIFPSVILNFTKIKKFDAGNFTYSLEGLLIWETWNVALVFKNQKKRFLKKWYPVHVNDSNGGDIGDIWWHLVIHISLSPRQPWTNFIFICKINAICKFLWTKDLRTIAFKSWLKISFMIFCCWHPL